MIDGKGLGGDVVSKRDRRIEINAELKRRKDGKGNRNEGDNLHPYGLNSFAAHSNTYESSQFFTRLKNWSLMLQLIFKNPSCSSEYRAYVCVCLVKSFLLRENP